MFTCERCGAQIPPNLEQCQYCGTVSAHARAYVQAEQARYAAEQAHLAAQVAILRQKTLSVTEQAASRALMWGLASFVFFCLPIFNVLSFLQFKRAQSTAKEAGMPTPQRAIVGLVISVFTGVLCVVCWVWMITDVRADNARVDARKVELGKQIAAHPPGPALDHPFACALAEEYVLTNGFDNVTNTGQFKDLTCAGAVRLTGEGQRAEMADFKFKSSSSPDGQHTVVICFKKGERWFVESVRATSCELPSSDAQGGAAAQ